MEFENRVCFWVIAGDDFDGILVLSRDDLREYLKGLSYQDRQGMQITPFELSQLPEIIEATGARLLIMTQE